MGVQAFHPILYVADPDAERDFYTRFGFETIYEGEEFPGFIAVGRDTVRFGLSRNRDVSSPSSYEGVRWQLVVEDVDEIVELCTAAGLTHELIVEERGETHRSRIAKVTSPNGVEVWFEGPNELG